jgi:hypothetical protein
MNVTNLEACGNDFIPPKKNERGLLHHDRWFHHLQFFCPVYWSILSSFHEDEKALSRKNITATEVYGHDMKITTFHVKAPPVNP